MIHLERVMSKRVLTIAENKSLQEAARVMNRHGIGSLVVKRKQTVVGILTERDILAVVARGRSPGAVKVADVMSHPVVVASPTTDLEDAVKMMVLNGIKKLPVLHDDKLVGIVTFTDFARMGPMFHDVLQTALAQAKKPKVDEKKFERFVPEPPSSMYA